MRSMLIALAMLVCPMTSAHAQVSVAIAVPGISLGINVPAYPEFARVPGYPVYYAPRLRSNYFFYDGLYWAYQDGTDGTVAPLPPPHRCRSTSGTIRGSAIRARRNSSIRFKGGAEKAAPRGEGRKDKAAPQQRAAPQDNDRDKASPSKKGAPHEEGRGNQEGNEKGGRGQERN